MKKTIYLLFITLLLISCNNNDKSDLEELTGIVLDKYENSVFISSKTGPYYAYIGDLNISDINLGDTVTFGFDGAVMESYPMQINASHILDIKVGVGLKDLSGKVVSVEETSVKIESDGQQYIVHLEAPVVFDADASQTIEEGNDITVTYNGEIMESYPMQIKGLRVKANDKVDIKDNSDLITIDKREIISGIIGVFPQSIISDSGDVYLNDVFAIELSGDYTYELNFDNLKFETLLDGYHGNYYYGFTATSKGEHVISFKQMSGSDVVKTIEIFVNVK